MEKRYQIRVGTHKVDFYYDADAQTWRARRPGTQDYTTGPAGTLEAARDAVRRHIEDEEPPGESLFPGLPTRHAGTLPPGTAPAPPSRESGNGTRRRAAGKRGGERIGPRRSGERRCAGILVTRRPYKQTAKRLTSEPLTRAP